MGKIFCIMGKSSSGKDTIFKLIKEDKTLKLNEIVGYTTRPIRENETNGVEYNFIDIKELRKLEEGGVIIESRCYHTVQGDWNYLTVDDENINLEKENYIVIITLEAYNNYKKYYGSNKIEPIYIDLDDGVRLTRAVEREMNQTNPNYDEVCRRFIADNKDFSKENLRASGVNKSFLNYDLDETVNNIREYIKSLT